MQRIPMCSYAEHVGATIGCIVGAAGKEAIVAAFSLSTDATGVAIQPTLGGGKRQPAHGLDSELYLAEIIRIVPYW